jgi:hypothetical protein
MRIDMLIAAPDAPVTNVTLINHAYAPFSTATVQVIPHSGYGVYVMPPSVTTPPPLDGEFFTAPLRPGDALHIAVTV